jgi:glycerol dehydrogenase-like iron-containing ADH family enzyme
MDDIQWFSPRFIGMRVIFTEGRVGTWVLTHKISDRFSQETQWEFNLLHGISAAYGTFACANVNNTRETAIMRIFMQ